MNIVWRILWDGSVTVGSDPITKCFVLSHLSLCKKDDLRKSLNMPSSLWKKRLPATRLLLRPWLSEHQTEQNNLFLLGGREKGNSEFVFAHCIFYPLTGILLFHHS